MFELFKQKKSSTKTAGLCLTENSISLAVINHSNPKKPALIDYRHRKIDETADLSKVLNELIAQAKISEIPISVVLPFEYYNLFLTEAPPVSEDELSDAVRWSLREMIDYPMEEAVVEAFALPKPNRPGSKASVYAAVINYAQLAEVFGVLNSCKMQLERIEVCETALSRLAQLNSTGEEPAVTICQGVDRVFVEVSKNDTLYVTRNMFLETEKRDEKKESHSSGLLNFSLDSLEEEEEDGFGESVNALELELQLQRSMDYYESQYQQGTIKNLRLIRSTNTDLELLDNLNTNSKVALIELNELIDGAERLTTKDKSIKDAYQLQVIGAALKVA